MDTYWIPGVNNLGIYGRWAFLELRNVYLMDAEFKGKIEAEFKALVAAVSEQGKG